MGVDKTPQPCYNPYHDKPHHQHARCPPQGSIYTKMITQDTGWRSAPEANERRGYHVEERIVQFEDNIDPETLVSELDRISNEKPRPLYMWKVTERIATRPIYRLTAGYDSGD